MFGKCVAWCKALWSDRFRSNGWLWCLVTSARFSSKLDRLGDSQGPCALLNDKFWLFARWGTSLATSIPLLWTFISIIHSYIFLLQVVIITSLETWGANFPWQWVKVFDRRGWVRWVGRILDLGSCSSTEEWESLSFTLWLPIFLLLYKLLISPLIRWVWRLLARLSWVAALQATSYHRWLCLLRSLLVRNIAIRSVLFFKDCLKWLRSLHKR